MKKKVESQPDHLGG